MNDAEEPWGEGRTCYQLETLECPHCAGDIYTSGDYVWCAEEECGYGRGDLPSEQYVTWEECVIMQPSRWDSDSNNYDD